MRRIALKHVVKTAALGMALIAALACAPVLMNTAAWAQTGTSDLQEEHDYTFAYGLFQDKLYQLSYEQLQKFIADHPTSAKQPDALFLSGECQFYLQQYASAVQAYQRFLRDYPRHSLSTDAAMRVGEIQFRQGSYDEAIAAYKAVAAEKDSAAAGEASYWIGESYLKKNDVPQAMRYYTISAERYPHNRLADYAVYSLGWASEQKKDYASAIAFYKKITQNNKQSDLQSVSLVRIGECLFQDGNYDACIGHLIDAGAALKDTTDRIRAEFLIAEAYFSKGDYIQARSRYETFLAAHPGNPLYREARYSYAWTFLETKEYDRAVELFGGLASGSDDIAGRSLFRKARTLQLAGKTEEALAAYTEAGARGGDDADNGLYEAGMIYYQRNQKDKALELFKQTVKEYPAGDAATDAQRMIGETLLAEKKFDAAAEAFKNAQLRAAGNDTLRGDVLFQQAWAFFKLKKFDDAAKLFDRFTQQHASHPKLAEGIFWAAESYFQAGRMNDAERFYSQFVRKYPSHEKFEDALYGLAWTELKAGKHGLAAASFEKLIAMHASARFLFDSRLRLGDALYAQKEFSKASAAYRAAIKNHASNPDVDYAYYQLAQSLYRTGSEKDGLDAFAELIHLYPRSQYADDAQYGIGLIYFQQKKYERAIAEFKTLASEYPKSDYAPRAYYSVGDAYYNLERYQEAINAYRVVMEKYPSSPAATDAVNGVQYCFSLLGKTDEAARVIDAFVAAHPDSRAADDLLLKKGELYYGEKNFSRAAEAYREFISRYPNSPLAASAHYWLGKSHAAQNNAAAAADEYEIVTTKYPSSAIASGALFESGALAMQSKRYGDAVRAFSALQEKYPKSDEAPEGAYQQGLAMKESGQGPASLRQWEAVVARYPKSAAADRSRLALGWAEQNAARAQNAANYFRAVAANRSDKLAAEAQYGIGLALQSQGNFKDAVVAYMRVKYVFPAAGVWIAKAFFGMGECYEKTQQVQKAKDAYQFVAKQTHAPELAAPAQERLKQLDRL
jgi:TolA-binding protein